jgi:hypothetical protein
MPRIALILMWCAISAACAPEALTDYPVANNATNNNNTNNNNTNNSGPVKFTQVVPILRTNCATFDSCHGSATSVFPPRIANARMATADDVRAALEGTTASGGRLLIKPGDAAGSYLFVRLTDPSAGPSGLMPLGMDPLDDADIELIRRWINEGANYTDAPAGDMDVEMMPDMTGDMAGDMTNDMAARD